MNDINLWTICWATSTSHSLKHTRKYGEHKPLPSPLLANELTNLFLEVAIKREGDEIPININNIYEDGIYFEFLSQTSYNINDNQFREIGVFVNNIGLGKIVHFIEYDDTDRFEKKKNEISSFGENIFISIIK